MKSVLNDVFIYTEKWTWEIKHSDELFLFRPLDKKDFDGVKLFLNKLSVKTQQFSSWDSEENEDLAREWCEAINKYDKLRFVLVNNDEEVIGLFELSFDVPKTDRKRYSHYEKFDFGDSCRFGLCLSDEYQSKGIASEVFSKIIEIVHKFDRKIVILWGGVHADNVKAIRFYKKMRFRQLGKFTNTSNKQCFDMMLEI